MSSENWRKLTCDNCATEVVEDPDQYWEGEDDALYKWFALTAFDDNAGNQSVASGQHFCSKECLKTQVEQF